MTERGESTRSSFRSSDGLAIRYAVDDFCPPWRSAETVVLLHANMGSMARFRAWVPLLAGRFRVVRWDMRGHGGSDLPPPVSPVSMARLTQDLVELLDHLGLARAHVAGSSTGGIIGMHAAFTRPERLASLASFAAIPGLARSAGLAEYLAWTRRLEAEGVREVLRTTIAHRFDPARSDPRFVEWWIAESARTDARLAARFLRMMTEFDFADRLHEIRCPTLFVVPGGDPEQSEADYGRLRAVPDHRFVVLAGEPHNITDAAPERCAAELRAFLESLGPGA